MDMEYKKAARQGAAKKMAKAKPKGKGISDEQKAKLREHSKHHSKKHMAMMNNMMREGSSFEEAHKAAMEEVGK